ncbi:50S ribosomal protein L16 [Nanoarchaeota archaeon]
MAKLRKAVAYRAVERPYTRKSKFRKLNFIRATPNLHVVKFDMGDPNKKFDYKLELKSKSAIQIRHNALESGRKSSNRLLDKGLGKNMYRMRIRVYPHHVLRENPMATGAGADRMSEGMKRAFGKPIGLAAQLKKGQTIVEVEVNKANLDLGKTAMKRFSHKMPCSCTIDITQN